MSLTPHDIARMLDHSTLQPFLTEDDIRRGCELALKYNTASVCARPCDVPILAEMLRGSDVKVCTVIGFPHGAHATQIKVDEARLALDQGCEELDMVINIGEMIRGNEAYVQGEIKQICDLAHSRNAIVKVILETCYLTDAQKKRCCELSEAAGADFGAHLEIGGERVDDQSSVSVLYSGFTSKWRAYSSTTTPPTEPGRYTMTVVVLGGNYLASPINRSFQITK